MELSDIKRENIIENYLNKTRHDSSISPNRVIRYRTKSKSPDPKETGFKEFVNQCTNANNQAVIVERKPKKVNKAQTKIFETKKNTLETSTSNINSSFMSKVNSKLVNTTTNKTAKEIGFPMNNQMEEIKVKDKPEESKFYPKEKENMNKDSYNSNHILDKYNINNNSNNINKNEKLSFGMDSNRKSQKLSFGMGNTGNNNNISNNNENSKSEEKKSLNNEENNFKQNITNLYNEFKKISLKNEDDQPKVTEPKEVFNNSMKSKNENNDTKKTEKRRK